MKTNIMLEQNLRSKKCKTQKKGHAPLKPEFVKGYLSRLPDWKLSGKKIVRLFEFEDFYETIGFVNAIAYIANQEDHHPDMEVSYKTCKVRYSTHAIGGLSENDFICAAKLDGLISTPKP